MNKIYLDYAATSPLLPNVIDGIESSFNWHNPSSYYDSSMYAYSEIEDVRLKFAHLINAKPEEIIFTSGGSESNTLAINGFLEANLNVEGCFCSNFEHSSILNNPRCVPVLKCNHDGLIDVENLQSRDLADRLFAVMMVNNELGTVQPIKKLARKIHHAGGYLFVDGVQALGKEPIDVKGLDVDMMSFSGHKIGALKGIGVLYVKDGIEISPLIYGTQENGLRGGTYNHLAISSLKYAIEYVSGRQNMSKIRVNQLKNYLLVKFAEHGGIAVNGSVADSSPYILNIRIPGMNLSGQQLVGVMDQLGFEISAGSACHSGDSSPSHVLKAIGLSDEDAAKSIRISFGFNTTKEDIENFCETLLSVLDFT